MSWSFLNGDRFTSGNTLYEMTYDGRDVWVSASGSKIIVYSYMGENGGSEETIDLSAHISDVKHIIKAYDEMYVFNDSVTQFVRVNIASKEVVGATISVARSVNCVPAYGKLKLWFVTKEDSNNIQKLFYYDIINGTWSTPVNMPGKHQSSKRKIVWGLSDYIYVVNLNESGMSKFSADTGAFILQISTNRTAASGSHVIVNDTREILISGFSGMVSSVNQDTNAATNISGLSQETSSFVDDGTYLWTVKPSVSRITKGSTVDNYLSMKAIPQITGESHSNIYYTFGFSLNQPDITSLTSVKQGSTSLVNGLDYTFETEDAFAEQRMTILRDAPNITGDEPFTITVDYSYLAALKDFEITGFSSTTFKQVLNTPTYTHEYWDENSMTIKTITEPQRIVLLADNKIWFAYDLTDSWNLHDLRGYELTIKGNALIGTGQNAYHGETQ